MKNVTIYTDGACSGNPGPGGWGAILEYKDSNNKPHKKEVSGFDKNTTNNRMELTAAIEALNVLKESCNIDLFTDSKYVMDGVTKWIFSWKARNWQGSNKQQVKNKDLWLALDKAITRHKIKWHWVKGHAGIEGNEKADELARIAIENNR